MTIEVTNAIEVFLVGHLNLPYNKFALVYLIECDKRKRQIATSECYLKSHRAKDLSESLLSLTIGIYLNFLLKLFELLRVLNNNNNPRIFTRDSQRQREFFASNSLSVVLRRRTNNQKTSSQNTFSTPPPPPETSDDGE